MTYGKVLSIKFILTIASVVLMNNIYANRDMTVDMSSAYFYKDSYEGFAGYCTIITPRITEISAKMQDRLNIVSQETLINASHHNNKKNYRIVRQPKAKNIKSLEKPFKKPPYTPQPKQNIELKNNEIVSILRNSLTN